MNVLTVFGIFVIYLFGFITVLYICRRKNPMVWKYSSSGDLYIKDNTGLSRSKCEQIFEKEFFGDKFLLFLYSIFYPITIFFHGLILIGITIFKITCGQTNSLFSFIDSILDAPKQPKNNKQIIGYSLDETSIAFPTLIRAKEAAQAEKADRIYIHYADETHELVN